MGVVLTLKKSHIMQDKKPRNEQGQAHGLWKQYWSNDVYFCVGHYINNLRYGHFIWKNKRGIIESNEYYGV